MDPFGCMPAVRTPEAPQVDSHIMRGLRFRLPHSRDRVGYFNHDSISGLSSRSLLFRPTTSLSTLRSGRYRSPRKTLVRGCWLGFAAAAIQATEFNALARRNPR